MLVLAAILTLLGLLVSLIGGIWLIVAAFQRSIAWGLCVIFVPLANVVFVFYDWKAAKGPFVCWLLGLMFLGGSWSVVDSYQRHGGKLPYIPQLAALAPKPPGPREPGGIADQGMFKAKKDADLQIKLVSLHQRETNLLLRKAELDPGDRAGAAALAEEIKKYNAELQPVLQAMKASNPAPAATPSSPPR